MTRNFTFAINEYYHLYNRGSDHRVIFLDKIDQERFIALLYLCNDSSSIHLSLLRGKSLTERLQPHRDSPLVDIGAYCLMPNHFHILVREKVENGISKFMQKLVTAYTMYFNKRYVRTGVLFQGKFKAQHIQNDNHLKYLFAYIHLNPIKIFQPTWKDVGLTDTNAASKFLRQYGQSSYMDYLGLNRLESKIINRDAFPDYFRAKSEFEDYLNDWLTFKNAY